MSLYQKYRAKKFSEILTQGHVKSILQSSLKTNSFGHAYLFVGTRGTGKTSLARIFARALNCQNLDLLKETGEPCNECQSCILSLNGSHTDIIEMDAASNRGIDEVRSLKESVDFLPSIGKYKVYIIDEAHMMTKEAFNALLKTIEEPPKHIVFIMCTTELFKLPATIISRSQVFELRNASIDEIVAKIDVILKAEGADIDNDAKRMIAKLGKGSFRDTESILEKLIGSAKDKLLDLDGVVTALGLSSIMLIENVKKVLYTKDLKVLQSILENELDEGSISNFNHQLAESVYEDIVESLASNQVDAYKYEIFDFLASVDKELRNTTNPKLLYIAKLLNYVKNYSGPGYIVTASNHSPASQNQSSQPALSVPSSTNSAEGEIDSITTERMKKNPSELLRERLKRTPQSGDGERNLPNSNSETSKSKVISKIDFLNFMKDKNSYLFRFFSSHEFQIGDDKIIVQAEKQMEKDLMMRTQTLDIINIFAEKFGTNLRLEIGDPKIDMRKKEEKVVAEIQKKVEDLGDDELENIFKV